MDNTTEGKIGYKELRFSAKLLRARGQLSLLAVLLVFKLLTNFVFLPALRLIWSGAVWLSPVSYITSGEIQTFYRSPLLLLAGLLMGILFAVWEFYEFSLLICGLHACFERRRFRIRKLLIESGMRICHVFLPKNWPMLLLVAVLIPFTNLFMTSDFISQLVVPEYIMEVIRDEPLYLFGYGLIVAVGIVLTVLWLLSFHLFILEKKDFLPAVKESTRMIFSRLFGTVYALIRWNVAILIRFVLQIFSVWIAVLIVLILVGTKSRFWMQALGFAFTYFELPFLEGLIECVLLIAQLSMVAALYYRYCTKQKIVLDEASGKKDRFRAGVRYPVALGMLATGGVTAILCAAFWAAPELLEDFYVEPSITCHRGYSAVAPENTLPAFEAAIEAGADCAELDVQMTKDGVVVVTHDTNLKRCTGLDANIYELTYAEVQELDAGSFFSPEFAGTKLPTLEEVIRLAKGRIRLNIEIKQNGHSPELEAETARIILAEDFADECTITSLNYESLCKVKEAAPELETGYILALGVGNYYDLPNVDFFSVETTFINSNVVNAIHQRDKKISAWTIDREEDASRMISLGVDDLITGKPDMVRECIEEEELTLGEVLDEIFEAVEREHEEPYEIDLDAA